MSSRRGAHSRSKCNQAIRISISQTLTPAQAVKFKAAVEKTNKGDPADWRSFQELLGSVSPARINKLSRTARHFVALKLAAEYQQHVPDLVQGAYTDLLRANPNIYELDARLLVTAAMWRFNNDYRRGKLFVSQGPIKPRPKPRAPADFRPPDPADARGPRASIARRHRLPETPVNILPRTQSTDRDIDDFSSAWAEANRRGAEAGLIIHNLAARAHLSRRDQYLLILYETYPAIETNAWTAKVMTAIGYQMTARQISHAKQDLFPKLRDVADLSLPLAQTERAEKRAYQQLAGAFRRLFESAVNILQSRPQLPAAVLQQLRAQLPKQRAELDRRLDCLLPAKPAAPAPRKSTGRVKKQPQVLSEIAVQAGQVPPFAPAPAL